jgi:hypothetical protein
MADSFPTAVGDTRRISIRRIKSGSVFKLVFASVATVFVPMMLLFGVLAFFGADTVSVSGEHVKGVKGLVASIIMAPIFVVIFSLFGWLGAYIGIRVWGHFSPLILEYVPAPDPAPGHSQDPVPPVIAPPAGQDPRQP